MNFTEKLLTASKRNQSLLCIGLDPHPELMPEVDVFRFNREIIDATSDLVCAYKPNLAYYEALGIEGMRALEMTLAHIPQGIPVIGDAKRGDIDSSSRAYAKALFKTLGFDAATVNPYLGYDSISAFLDYTDNGVFILCKTSNAGAVDFQEALYHEQEAGSGTRPLYEIVATKASEWNIHGNVGLVVGATHPRQLKKVRELCPDMLLLLPGVGSQGGDLELAVRHGVDASGEKAIISCSRQILYASREHDFAEAARKEALKLRALISEYLAAGR
jgi:orotidine-5'-phosphate decarboxylase